MNFENAMLSEKSQSQKTTYFMVPFTCNIYKRPKERGWEETKRNTEGRLVVAKGWKEGVFFFLVGGVGMTTKGFLFKVMKYSKITYW